MKRGVIMIKQIQLESVPKKYHRILDELWDLGSTKELVLYLHTCSDRKREIAESLVELLQIEMLDRQFEKSKAVYLDDEFNTYMKETLFKQKKDKTE